MADCNCVSVLLLCTFVVVLSITNVFVECQKSSSRSSDIPVSNLRVKNYLGPTLKFLYW
jgi:hypothetical protein